MAFSVCVCCCDASTWCITASRSFGVTVWKMYVFSFVNLVTPEQGAQDGDARGVRLGWMHVCMLLCSQHTDHRSLDVCICISYTVTPERVPFRDNSNLYRYSWCVPANADKSTSESTKAPHTHTEPLLTREPLLRDGILPTVVLWSRRILRKTNWH
jgi:hypothetical protein